MPGCHPVAGGEAPRNQRRADATRLLLGIADESGDHLERLLDSRLREKRLELRAQLRGCLVAPRRIAPEATRDDLRLAVAHRRTHRPRVFEVAVEDGAKQGGGAGRLERQLAAGKPVQDGPEGEEVAAWVRRFSLDRLGR